MVDEGLRERMVEAYSAGEYERALQLSQQLDKQIAGEQAKAFEKYKRSRKNAG